MRGNAGKRVECNRCESNRNANALLGDAEEGCAFGANGWVKSDVGG